MAKSAVYASGTLIIRIGKNDLLSLIHNQGGNVSLSLHENVLSEKGIHIYLTPACQVTLREIVKAEEKAREEAKLQIKLSNPGYRTHAERRQERRNRGKS